MEHYYCDCLNVSIHFSRLTDSKTNNIKDDPQTIQSYNECSADEKEFLRTTGLEKFYPGGFGIGGIKMAVPSLISAIPHKQEQRNGLVLFKCLNCNMPCYCQSRNNTILLNANMMNEQSEAVKAKRNSPLFSKAFDLVIYTDNSTGKFKTHFNEQDTVVMSLQNKMEEVLKREKEAMEQRIREFEEQQRQELKNFHARAQREKLALITRILRIQDDEEQQRRQQQVADEPAKAMTTSLAEAKSAAASALKTHQAISIAVSTPLVPITAEQPQQQHRPKQQTPPESSKKPNTAPNGINSSVIVAPPSPLPRYRSKEGGGGDLADFLFYEGDSSEAHRGSPGTGDESTLGGDGNNNDNNSNTRMKQSMPKNETILKHIFKKPSGSESSESDDYKSSKSATDTTTTTNNNNNTIGTTSAGGNNNSGGVPTITVDQSQTQPQNQKPLPATRQRTDRLRSKQAQAILNRRLKLQPPHRDSEKPISRTYAPSAVFSFEIDDENVYLDDSENSPTANEDGCTGNEEGIEGSSDDEDTTASAVNQALVQPLMGGAITDKTIAQPQQQQQQPQQPQASRQLNFNYTRPLLPTNRNAANANNVSIYATSLPVAIPNMGLNGMHAASRARSPERPRRRLVASPPTTTTTTTEANGTTTAAAAAASDKTSDSNNSTVNHINDSVIADINSINTTTNSIKNAHDDLPVDLRLH